MILALLAGLAMGAGVAVWAVDQVSNGACTMASAGCMAARLTAVGMGAALLAGVVLLAVVLPRRTALAWSVLLLLAALLGGLGAVLAGRQWVYAGAISLASVLAALLGLSVWDIAARMQGVVGRRVGALLRNPSWLLLLAACVAGTVFYVQRSHRILFWDPLNYWQKTDQVAALVQHGLGLHDIARLLRTASDDYSMIPALLPGLLTSGVPQDNILAYLLAVAICYVFPAAIAVGWLGLLLAGGRSARVSGVSLVVLGGVAGLVVLPVFLYTFIGLAYLDIGGVPVVIMLACALSYAVGLVCRASDPGLTEPSALQLVAAGVALALLALLAFVFRRWYVFDVIGLGLGAGLWMLAGMLRMRRGLRAVVILGLSAGLTGLTAGAPVIVDWAATWQRRQFTESYAAYWLGWRHEAGTLTDSFGLLVPACCLLLLLWLVLRGPARRLAFIVLFGCGIALGLFFRVQGLSSQHLYIVMPALAGAAASGAILLAKRVGLLAPAALVALAAVLVLFVPRQDGALAYFLPKAVDLRPKSDPNIPELLRLAHWLRDNLGPDDGYCVLASSLQMNGSMVAQTWQVDPTLAHSRVRDGFYWLGEVDTWQGPPAEKIKSCTIMITTTPPVTDLKPSDQQSILLPRQDLLDGTGIGRAYAKMPVSFTVNGLTVETWKLQRPITDAELGDLRRRFFEGKGAEAARYRARFTIQKFDSPG